MLIFCIVAGCTLSCYDDKGSYDYIDIRDINLSFTPEGYTDIANTSESVFKFKQPLGDTALVRIDPILKTSKGEIGTSFEYFWIKPGVGNQKTDTIRTSHLDVKLAPRAHTDLTYILKITDTKTTLDYYRTITIRTITPFVNSWFVLHGTDNNMKIGTGERNEDNIWVTSDAYFDLHGVRRFENAQSLMYVRAAFDDYTKAEMLTVIGGDSLFALYPFDLTVHNLYERMMPPIGYRPFVTDGISDRNRQGMLRDNNKKLFVSPGEGMYYPMLTQSEDADYQASGVALHSRRVAVIWDAQQKKFYNYFLRNNNFGWWNFSQRNDAGNTARIEPFEEDFFPADEFQNQELIKIIPDVWDEKGISFLALFSNIHTGVVTRYHIIVEDDDNDEMTYKKLELRDLTITAAQNIAYSYHFNNQIFYTAGNILYHYDMTNQENSIIYQVSDNTAVIDDAIFRWYMETNVEELSYFTRTIGLVVNYPDNRGEIHELILENSTDVEQVYIFSGFEHVKSAIFSESRVVR